MAKTVVRIIKGVVFEWEETKAADNPIKRRPYEEKG